MQLEASSLCRGLRWPYLSLLLTSVLSAAVTDPKCACSAYGSCIFSSYFNSCLHNKRNVAVGKQAKMSSVYRSAKWNEISGPACLAVNGNTNRIFIPLNEFSHNPNCIHTGDNDHEPYWEVDLGQRYSINSITVYWRSNWLQERSYGVNITVDGQLCHTFGSPVFSNPSDIICVTQLAGQTVRLSKIDHTKDGDFFITVCEVEVWVCCPGFFGKNCQYVCPEPVCKNNQVCSPVDGTCPKESYSSGQTQAATIPVTARLTPATCDITKLVFPVVGAVLAGSVVIGICIAAVLWLRRSRDRRLGLTAEARGAGGMVTELGDVGRSEVRAQSSGNVVRLCQTSLCDNQTQEDYVNLHDVNDVAVRGRKGNKYLAFPARKSDKSGLSSDLSDDGEYEEMK